MSGGLEVEEQRLVIVVACQDVSIFALAYHLLRDCVLKLAHAGYLQDEKRRCTFFDLERGFAAFYSVHGPFKDLLWWLEVLGQFRVRRGDGICRKVLDDRTMEERLLCAVYGRVVGVPQVVPGISVPMHVLNGTQGECSQCELTLPRPCRRRT